MNTLTVGENLIFTVEPRTEGVSVHLMVRLPAQPPQRKTRQFVQVWRADCFHEHPHEHLFSPEGEEQTFLDGDFAQQPIRWCIGQLRNLSSVLTRAGYPADQLVDQEEVNEHLPDLLHWLLGPPYYLGVTRSLEAQWKHYNDAASPRHSEAKTTFKRVAYTINKTPQEVINDLQLS